MVYAIDDVTAAPVPNLFKKRSPAAADYEARAQFNAAMARRAPPATTPPNGPLRESDLTPTLHPSDSPFGPLVAYLGGASGGTNQGRKGSVVAGELEDAQRRIDSWAGTDNDPILDRLVRERNNLREELASSEDLNGQSLPDAMTATATAMREGVTPQDAGLPDYLFPRAYVDDAAEITAAEQQVEELAIDAYVGETRPAEIPAALEDLDEARAALPRPLEATVEHLQTTPLLAGYEASEVAGEHLGAEYLSAWESSDPVGMENTAVVLESASEHDFQTAGHFYRTLGAERTADIPLALSREAVYSEPGGPSAITLRDFSVSLGRASTSGVNLGFSGEDVVRGRNAETGPARILDVSPALLLKDGQFSDRFATDATAQTLIHYQGPMPGRGTPDVLGNLEATLGLMMSEDEYVTDIRLMMLRDHVADPDAAGDLLEALGQNNLEALIDPQQPYFEGDIAGGGQYGSSAGYVLSLAAHETGGGGIPTDRSTEWTDFMLTEIVQRDLPDGVEVGIADMANAHLSAFIPDSVDVSGTPIVRSPLFYTTDEEFRLDALNALAENPAAAAMLDQGVLLYTAQVARTVLDPANPETLSAVAVPLGALSGRVDDVLLNNEVDDAQRRDSRNKLIGFIASGVYAGGSVALGFTTLGASVGVQTVLLAGNTGVGIGADRLFPTGHAEDVLIEHVDERRLDPLIDSLVLLDAMADADMLPDGLVPADPAEWPGFVTQFESRDDLINYVTEADASAGTTSSMAIPLEEFFEEWASLTAERDSRIGIDD